MPTQLATSTVATALDYSPQTRIGALCDGSLAMLDYDGTNAHLYQVTSPSSTPSTSSVHTWSLTAPIVSSLYILNNGSTTSDVWVVNTSNVTGGAISVAHATYTASGSSWSWDNTGTAPWTLGGFGTPTIVWTGTYLIAASRDYTSSSYKVNYSYTTTKNGSTGWSAAAQLSSTSATGSHYFPILLHDTTNSCTVAVYTINGDAVEARVLPDSSTPALANWSAETRISSGSTATTGAANLSATLDPSAKNLHVAWVDTAQTACPTYCKSTYTTTAITAGTQFQLATASTAPRCPTIGVDSGGNVFLLWESNGSGTGDIEYAKIVSPYASGNVGTITNLTNNSAANNTFPQVPTSVLSAYVPLIYLKGTANPWSVELDTSIAAAGGATVNTHNVQAASTLALARSHAASAVASLALARVRPISSIATLALPITHSITASATLALARSHAVAATATLALPRAHGVQAVVTLQTATILNTHAISASAALAIPRPHGVTATATLIFVRTHPISATASLALAQSHPISATVTLALARPHGVAAVATISSTPAGTGIGSLAVTTKSQSWSGGPAGSPGTETDVTYTDAKGGGWAVGLIPSYGGLPISSWYEVDSNTAGANQTSLTTSTPDGHIHWLEDVGASFAGSEDKPFTLTELAPVGTSFRRYYQCSFGPDANGFNWVGYACIYPGDPGMIAYRFDITNPGASAITLNNTSADAMEIALIGGLQQSDTTWAPANGGYGVVGGANTVGWPASATGADPDYVYIPPASGHSVSIGVITVRQKAFTALSPAWSTPAVVYLQNTSRLKLKVQGGMASFPASTTSTFYALNVLRRSLTAADAAALAADYLAPGTPTTSVGSFTSYSYDERAYVFAATSNALTATLDLTPAHVTARYKPILKVTGWTATLAPLVTWGGVTLTNGVDYQYTIDTTNQILYLQVYCDVVASGATQGQRNNAAVAITAPAVANTHGVQASATLAVPRAHGVSATAALIFVRTHPISATASLAVARTHVITASATLALARPHGVSATAAVQYQRTRAVQSAATLALAQSHGVSAVATIQSTVSARTHASAATVTLATPRQRGVTAQAVLLRVLSHAATASVSLAVAHTRAVTAIAALATPHAHAAQSTASLALPHRHGIQAVAALDVTTSAPPMQTTLRTRNGVTQLTTRSSATTLRTRNGVTQLTTR